MLVVMLSFVMVNPVSILLALVSFFVVQHFAIILLGLRFVSWFVSIGSSLYRFFCLLPHSFHSLFFLLSLLLHQQLCLFLFIYVVFDLIFLLSFLSFKNLLKLLVLF